MNSKTREQKAKLKEEHDTRIERIVEREFAHDVVALRTVSHMIDIEIGPSPDNLMIAAQLLTAHHMATMNVGLRLLNEAFTSKQSEIDLAAKMWDA